MLNLRLPIAKWMPWLAQSLVKLCHESALRKSVLHHHSLEAILTFHQLASCNTIHLYQKSSSILRPES